VHKLQVGVAYEPRSPGLSWDFANEIRAAINRAVAMPFAWHILEAISGGHWCNAFSKAYFTYQSQINSPFLQSCTCVSAPVIGATEHLHRNNLYQVPTLRLRLLAMSVLYA